MWALVTAIIWAVMLSATSSGSQLDAAGEQRGAISGKVTDERGVGVAYVSVLLRGTTIGGLTGKDGNFNIIKVPVGTYDLVARLVGFPPTEKADVRVESGRTTIVNLTIKEKPVRIIAFPRPARGLVVARRPCAGAFDRKVGVAARFGRLFYLAIADSTLGPDVIVTVIDAERPARTQLMEITRRTAGGDWPRTPQMGPLAARRAYYLLESPGEDKPPNILGFGIVNLATTPRKEKGRWVLDVDGDRRLEVLDYCTGSETLKLYVRSAVTGEECWHGEYYLGYDVEPTCPESWKGGK